MIEIQSASLINQVANHIVAPQLKKYEKYKKEMWKNLGLSDRLTIDKFLENTYAIHYRSMVVQMLSKRIITTKSSKVVLQDVQLFLTELATFAISSLELNINTVDKAYGNPLRYQEKDRNNNNVNNNDKHTINKFELSVDNKRQLIVVPYPTPSEEEEFLKQLELDYSYNKPYNMTTPEMNPSPRPQDNEPNLLDKILAYNDELPMDTNTATTTTTTTTTATATAAATTIDFGADLSLSSTPLNSDSDEPTKQCKTIQKKTSAKKKSHKEYPIPTYEKPSTSKKHNESEQKKNYKKRKSESSSKTSKEKIPHKEHTAKRVKSTPTRDSSSENDDEEPEILPELKGNGAYEFMQHVKDCEKKNEMVTNEALFLRAQRQAANSAAYFAEYLLKAQNMLLQLPFKVNQYGQPILECMCCPIHCSDDSDLVPPRGRPQNGGVYQEIQKQQKKKEKQSKQQ